MKALCRCGLVLGLVFLLAPLINAQSKFTATLSGNEVVPAVSTPATGTATFELSRNGESLSYTLSVTDIENVTMAHIHIAPAGKDGPPVVWLYPSKPPAATKEGKFSGELAKGTITAANLAGPLKGKKISDLVTDIKDGNAYVNVHTTAHSAGEIRGQIK